MSTITLPELYAMAANGKRRFWRIKVTEGSYTVEYGLVGGKAVTATRNCAVKNVGKINETTPLTQALSEAKSKWTKKKDEGYSCAEACPVVAENARRGHSVVLPMLAQKYNADKPSMTFPCSVQPKLDGVRAMYYDHALWSRQGKRLTEVTHITDQLKDVTVILDGELYSYEMSFQEIISAVKKRRADTLKLLYVVYDAVSEENFPDRIKAVKTILSAAVRPNVKVLKTYRCETPKDVARYMKKFLREKYEGLILRSDIGPYVTRHRSKTLQKHKEFLDAEYEIVNFTEGSGTEKGLIIFECACPDGKTFKVRPTGTREKRRDMFVNGVDYIGRKLTVKYQELTDGGVPRFPVGIAIRDYE